MSDWDKRPRGDASMSEPRTPDDRAEGDIAAYAKWRRDPTDEERCPVDGCDELPEDHHHPACNDPRHDEIEAWYRQALELAAPPAVLRGADAAEWHRYLHAEGILVEDEGEECGPWHHRVFMERAASPAALDLSVADRPTTEEARPFVPASDDDKCRHPQEQRRTQVIEEPTIYEVCSGCEHVMAIRTGAASPAALDVLTKPQLAAVIEAIEYRLFGEDDGAMNRAVLQRALARLTEQEERHDR